MVGPETDRTVSESSPPRRHFLAELSALAVGGVISLAGLAAGMWVFLDPLLRKKTPPEKFAGGGGGKEGFIRIAALDAVPEDGIPRRFPVVANRIDAWNFTTNVPIGAIYLRRAPGEQLQVFQATCPHAGCSVAPAETAEGTAFHCPCHNSSFDLNGQRVSRPGKQNPSPRDLDQLEVDAEKLAAGEIWVRYQEFYTGREEKKPRI